MHRSAAGPSLALGCVVRALGRYYAPLRLPLGGSLPAQEGLSSSVHDAPCIPRPLRRGVLGGCVSQVFPTSMGLRLLGPGSAPPCPLHSEEYNGAADFALCCGLQVCSVSFRGLCQRALTPASRPAQAGAWDFVTAQLLGGWGLTETGLSPASHARLIWTHSHRHLTPAQRPVSVLYFTPAARPLSRPAAHPTATGASSCLGGSHQSVWPVASCSQ